MRSWVVLLVVWQGLCFLGSAYAASAADAVLAEASSALAAGQYQDAVTLANDSLGDASVPDLTRCRLLAVRGLSEQALGLNNDALTDFTQALSVSALPLGERSRALFARGVSLDSLGRLDDALGDYSAVLRLAPNAAYALNNRANIYRRQNRFEEARRDYLASLNGTNSNPQYPYFGLGLIAESQGDTQGARGFYSKAVAADPSFQLALDRLQALGAPAGGLARLPVDTGIIALHPLPRRADDPVVPPLPRNRPLAAPQPVRGVPQRAPPQSRPSTPLRPAIVEGQKQPGALQVQLGAWRTEQEARDGWVVAQETAGELLTKVSPVIVRTEIAAHGIFYRLRVQAEGTPLQFCAVLRGKGLACIPVRD